MLRGVIPTGVAIQEKVTHVTVGRKVTLIVAARGNRGNLGGCKTHAGQQDNEMTTIFPKSDKYVVALSENRLEDAKHHLLELILAAKQINARPVLAGMAQRLGSILLRQGDKFGAIALYEFSEALDTGSLLAKLDYAKFLLREVGDKSAAQTKCEEIIAEATAHPFPGNDDDFSSDEYLEAATRLYNEARE